MRGAASGAAPPHHAGTACTPRGAGLEGSLGAAGEANGRREDAEEEEEADEADMALARGSAAAVSRQEESSERHIGWLC